MHARTQLAECLKLSGLIKVDVSQNGFSSLAARALAAVREGEREEVFRVGEREGVSE